ncbi:MAG: hypothetical protein V4721_07130 [Bacteroidota bacterium]
MKKVLLTLAVVGTIFLSACEKENLAQPAGEKAVKTDKGISCRGCGQWDIVDPDPSTTGLANYDGDPIVQSAETSGK